MTNQMLLYRRLATATFLLALALFHAQQRDIKTSHPSEKDNKPRCGTLRLFRAGSRSNHNDTKTMFLEEENRLEEHVQLHKDGDKLMLSVSEGGENLKGNATHALMIDSRTGRQWIVQKHSIEHYEAEFIDLVDRKYRPENTKIQLDILSSLGLGAVLEMEDGREFKCLASFHEVWRDEVWQKVEHFSGEPFLEWLDYGSGRELDSEICDRERLNRRRYQILNHTELDAHLVEIRKTPYLETRNENSDNDHQNNTTSTTTSVKDMVQAVFTATQQPVPPGRWLSVLDLNHNLYMFQGGKFPAPDQPFDYWKRGHGSVTGGRPVLYAGEIMINQLGRVDYIVSDSGHYRPKLQHSKAFYRWIRGIVGDAARATIDWKPAKSAMESERTVWETLFDDEDL